MGAQRLGVNVEAKSASDFFSCSYCRATKYSYRVVNSPVGALSLNYWLSEIRGSRKAAPRPDGPFPVTCVTVYMVRQLISWSRSIRSFFFWTQTRGRTHFRDERAPLALRRAARRLVERWARACRATPDQSRTPGGIQVAAAHRLDTWSVPGQINSRNRVVLVGETQVRDDDESANLFVMTKKR